MCVIYALHLDSERIAIVATSPLFHDGGHPTDTFDGTEFAPFRALREKSLWNLVEKKKHACPVNSEKIYIY